MSHCCRFMERPLSRRDMLARCANGFGALAFAALSGQQNKCLATSGTNLLTSRPLAPRSAHFAPRAQNVIFLYMDGGPSQMDTFDPKPRLSAEHGQPFKMKMEPTQFDNNGSTLGSPWKFQQYGQSGLPVSDLFPHVAQCIDELAIVRSMTADFSEHTAANYFLHTGNGQQGRPSMGAWASYGLGTECDNLPGFIVLNGGLIPPGGLDCFGSGFLPASYQGSMFKPGPNAVANVQPAETRGKLQRHELDFVKKLDAELTGRVGRMDEIETAIANAELAYRMQVTVPEVMDISCESAATRKLYGVESEYEQTRIFATECLLARRLVEQGVRFIELTCPVIGGSDRWDAHGGLKHNHSTNALATDQPIAGLLCDLKSRGLLDSTLVVWAGEFGRTPFAQGSDGRDHNPFAFTVWLAGGGIKGGTVYGQTDEYGYKVVQNKATIHDLHATMLHLLGIDHKRLTFHFSGRDMRLTDVHGEVIHDILA